MATDKTSLILDMSRGVNDKSQRSIPDVNPNATNSELLGFARQFAALSTDDLDKVSRVEKRTLTSDDNIVIYGGNEAAVIYAPGEEPDTQPDTSFWFALMNESTNRLVEPDTFTVAVSDYDTTKAEISGTGYTELKYAEIVAKHKADAYSEAKATLSATGNFGSVSKVVTIKFFKYEE